MGLHVVTPPTSDPISLAEAKAQLRVDIADDDGLIAGFILAAREFVENATRRRFITQTLEYILDCWPVDARGRQRIELPVLVIASITSVTYVDENGATQTLSAANYALRDEEGPVAYLEPAYGVSWPAARDQGEAITVRFVAGGTPSDVPNPLMQAMRLMIGHMYANREAVNVGNSVTEFPFGVDALLSAYRSPRLA